MSWFIDSEYCPSECQIQQGALEHTMTTHTRPPDDETEPMPTYVRGSAFSRAYEGSIFCSGLAAAIRRGMEKREREATEVQAKVQAMPLRPSYSELLSVAAARARVAANEAKIKKMTNGAEVFTSEGEASRKQWELRLAEWRAVRAALADALTTQEDRQRLLERWEWLTGLPYEPEMNSTR